MTSKSGVLRLMLALFITAAVAGPTAAGLGSPDSRSIETYTTPEAIAEAQGVLVKLHYLAPDSYTRGVRDDATTSAIVAFQNDHTVRGSGRLDFDTMALLMSHGPGELTVAKTPEKTEPIARAFVPAEAPKAPVVETPEPVVTPTPAPLPTPPVEVATQRAMPETDAPIGFIAGSGVLLLVAGLLLCLKRV